MGTAFSDAALRISIANLLEGVQIIAPDWIYLYVNDTAARHGHRPASELIGRTMMDCYPGIERTDVFRVLERVMRSRQSERVLNEFIYPSGERGWFDLLIEPVPDGICVLSLDVTDRRAAEQQLRQAHKLEAMGRLAGGVAHDFNNLLTAIIGYTELALEHHPDARVQADMREIQKAAQRAARLTRQLLAFSRKQGVVPQVLDVNGVVQDTEQMLSRLLGDVRIELHLAPDLASVTADPGQLEQVLLNLAINARDAMPQGGRVRIVTANRDVDAETARVHGDATPGQYVLLAVEDDGVGMEPAVLARALEPFFTTKGPETGTGLGLSTVHDIVRAAAGFLTIDSAVGKGTRVSVFLPAVAAPAAAAAPPVERGTRAASETLLVVERDDGLRRLMKRTLEAAGYTVLDAATASAAAAIAERDWGPIQLLITDTVMPEMHGAHLAQQLVSVHHEIKVLYVTGFPDTRASESGAMSPRIGLLLKPFTPAALVREVRRLLDS